MRSWHLCRVDDGDARKLGSDITSRLEGHVIFGAVMGLAVGEMFGSCPGKDAHMSRAMRLALAM